MPLGQPQIIVTPPLIRRERERVIYATQRRPSASSDQDGDHHDFDNVSTSSRDTRREVYADDTYNSTALEIDELQSLRTRSPVTATSRYPR